MSADGEAFVPDMPRRQLMNTILLGAIGVNVLGLAVPYVAFFVPKSSGGAGAGLVARDALGNEVTTAGWISTHLPGDRSLVQVSIFIQVEVEETKIT